jgi:hypothetical protein
MALTTEPKRKRGKRMTNQYPKKEVCYVIMEVGPEGQILAPPEYISRFCNAIGALVRDQLNPAIPIWSGKNGVPETKKQELWDKWLMDTFRLPAGKHELVKTCLQDNGQHLPMLEVRYEQEVYPEGVNSLP